MKTDDRIDFSSLDPTGDPERFEGIVRSIGERAAAELAARRARSDVFGEISRWWRPMLAAAAVTGIISIGTLTQVEPNAPMLASREVGLAEAIGVPTQLAEWVRSDEAPTTTELMLSLEDES